MSNPKESNSQHSFAEELSVEYRLLTMAEVGLSLPNNQEGFRLLHLILGSRGDIDLLESLYVDLEENPDSIHTPHETFKYIIDGLPHLKSRNSKDL